MPAQIVLVADQPGFVEEVSTALEASGYSVAAYGDSLPAIGALEQARGAEVLVTRMLFPPGKPNGVSLALMAMHRRLGIRVIFLGPAELQHHATGVGRFLSEPVSAQQVVAEVQRVANGRE